MLCNKSTEKLKKLSSKHYECLSVLTVVINFMHLKFRTLNSHFHKFHLNFHLQFEAIPKTKYKADLP